MTTQITTAKETIRDEPKNNCKGATRLTKVNLNTIKAKKDKNDISPRLHIQYILRSTFVKHACSPSQPNQLSRDSTTLADSIV